MIKKFLTFVNEGLNNEVIVNVKKHVKKKEYVYDDSDWDINPFHEFDDINRYLRGKEIYFVIKKNYFDTDDESSEAEIGIFKRLIEYKNQYYINYYKKNDLKKIHGGILTNDNIVVIKEKTMNNLTQGDIVWYHLGVNKHEWLQCEIVTFDSKRGKVFISTMNKRYNLDYPYSYWVFPKEIIKSKQ